MTRDKLIEKYFKWMCQFVCDKRYTGDLSYNTLLFHLHGVIFIYTLDMDANREEDGIDLRYRFGYENSYSQPIIATYLDDRPCSVLEMMIALAIRCEEHIMDDPDIGDRTGKWFWEMIDNLGLYSMDDANFDEDYFNDVISRFLNREYKRNGEGGLFTVKRYKGDLRLVEIWYQMCWHLNEII